MGEVTYTAIIGADELVIRQARRAGIDGPIFTAEFDRDHSDRPDLDDVDKILEDRGFVRVHSWILTKTYEGLSLGAELMEI